MPAPAQGRQERDFVYMFTIADKRFTTSVIPLGVAALIEVRESQTALMTHSADVLAARSDQREGVGGEVFDNLRVCRLPNELTLHMP
jgi:hypothetical protein